MIPYKQLAIEAAKEAGHVLVDFSKRDITYQMKSSHDILTQEDLKAEAIIVNKISSHFPEHSILSEEQGETINKSEFLWVIDPIDGTINFSRHIEEYCISLALSRNNEIILGVIYQPILDKLFVAEKGQGAFVNGEKIFVSSESELINSLSATDNSSKITMRVENFTILTKICSEVRHIRIFGSGALHLAKLAEGKLDFYFKTSCNYWDFAAGILILQEAGGKVTDFKGNPIIRSSKNIVASNSLLHQKALGLINR